MGFMLVDREKSGLSRYCPTFARAFECIGEGIRTRRQKKEMLELVREKKLEEIASRLSTPGSARILGQLANSRDYSVATTACWAIRKATENGADTLAAVPFLFKALHDRRYFYTRINAAMALKEIAAASDRWARMEIASYIDGYASRGMSGAMELDPASTPMLVDALEKAVMEMAKQDGAVPIARARLWRIRMSLRVEEAAEAHAKP